MNKLMTVVAASVCAVSFSAVALADADVSQEKLTKEEVEAVEEEEAEIFEAGVDFVAVLPPKWNEFRPPTGQRANSQQSAAIPRTMCKGSLKAAWNRGAVPRKRYATR